MHNKIYLFSINSHPKATHINSLDIVFLQPNIDFSKYDYLILTSKQASKALGQYKSSDYLDKKAVTVSKQSALSYEKIGGEILEVGKGYGDNLYELIRRYPKSKKWLYLRAEKVASDFAQRLREDGFFIDEAVVYKSQCSKDIAMVSVEEDATLIFTSPSSVKCFLEHHTINKRNKVVVIGKTTAKILPSSVNYTMAQKPTIESCLAQL